MQYLVASVYKINVGNQQKFVITQKQLACYTLGTTKLSMGDPVKFEITKEVLMFTHHLLVDNKVNMQVMIVKGKEKYVIIIIY